MKLVNLFLLFAVGLAVSSGSAIPEPREPERIVGGEVTSIHQYPFAVAVLIGFTDVFFQWCGGTIINNRSILSAAHCFLPEYPWYWRSRVGSTYASSGGVVHLTQHIFHHPQFHRWTLDNDVCVVRIQGVFSFNINVQPGSVGGPNYNLPDNTPVWALGWGTIYFEGPQSEQLRHVQIWTVNQEICRTRYVEKNALITDSMMCAGWLDVGGRDACEGDSGGPLLHNNVVVGITSFGYQCALPRFPGVFARVSRFTDFITSHA